MADAAEAIAGLGRIEDLYAVVLCDVFGVLHDATEVRPAAVAALRTFRAGGGTVVLVSNSAEPGPRLGETLRARGIAPEYDALVTSADIARILLEEQASERVHHIGPARDRILFEGLSVTLTGVESADLSVCTGYPDPDDDLDATLVVALHRGQPLLCTNPDTSLMVDSKRLRFAGLVAERYRIIGGIVVETGKPGELIYREALRRAGRLRERPVAQGAVLGIGDTWALDVVGALKSGFGAIHIGAAEPQERPLGCPGRLYRMPVLVW
ncbi:MAG: TIGR01459 family HAD-type hydrolase [Methylobacterium organophilum]|nr:TIGR01459 family HAD-type hydrolase [Methylobacterium organophilum]